MKNKTMFNLSRAAVSAVIAACLAAVLILTISETPLETVKLFFLGPFRSVRFFGNMIEAMVPILFSGIAFSILFRAAQFNLAVESVYLVAGLVGSLPGIYWALPAAVHPVVCMLVGGITGMIIMLIPAVLRAYLNANELLVSLMFNNISAGVVLYLLANHLKDITQSPPVTQPFQATAKLPVIVPGTRVHVGFIIALFFVALVYILLQKTKLGYEIRMTGFNEVHARYSGIDTKKVIIIASLLAGFVAGLGATVENIGLHERFEWYNSPGYGFDGAMIAILGANNPIGIFFSSLFVAYLRTGSSLTSRLADIPLELKDVLVGIIFIFVSAERFLQGARNKWLLKRHKS